VKDRVKRFPISQRQRIRNLQGEFAVPCQISDRWLSFDAVSSQVGGGEFISLDVFTNPTGDSVKKLCQLVVTREDLLAVLDKIHPKSPSEDN